MLTNGVMTINEVRALENLPPVAGGQLPRMQMQNVPITQAGLGAGQITNQSSPGSQTPGGGADLGHRYERGRDQRLVGVHRLGVS